MAQMNQREGGAAHEAARAAGGGWDLWRLFLPWPAMTEVASAASPPTRSGFAPQVDVAETEELYTVKADLPGVREEDLEVTVAGNQITISGKRREEPPSGNKKRLVSERAVGSFTRSFEVPESCDAGQIEAELKNGVLTVSVHHKPELRARKVEIGSEHAGEGEQAEEELSGDEAGRRRTRQRRTQQGVGTPRRPRTASARLRRS
jgi:HSP20 family protein